MTAKPTKTKRKPRTKAASYEIIDVRPKQVLTQTDTPYPFGGPCEVFIDESVFDNPEWKHLQRLSDDPA